MTKEQISEYMSELGKKGGAARAAKLTPGRILEIARNAGKAPRRPRRKKTAS